jgi:hypothetical protein
MLGRTSRMRRSSSVTFACVVAMLSVVGVAGSASRGADAGGPSKQLIGAGKEGTWGEIGSGRSRAANAAEPTPSSSAETQRLYGIAGPRPAGLVRVDPATLRPLPGLRVSLMGRNSGWSFSPDRSRMVLGSDAPIPKLRLIDLQKMRALGDVRVARRGSVFATAWAGRERVLAVVVTPACCGLGDTVVAGVDSASRRVLWRRLAALSWLASASGAASCSCSVREVARSVRRDSSSSVPTVVSARRRFPIFGLDRRLEGAAIRRASSYASGTLALPSIHQVLAPSSSREGRR